jgi:hypothetical protein
MKNLLTYLTVILILGNFIFANSNKINPKLIIELSQNVNKTEKVWVFFEDKGDNLTEYYSNPLLVVSKKSLERREKLKTFEKGIDYVDLPVNKEYIDELKLLGVRIINKSRWFNAVSCEINISQINLISKLDFVKRIEPVDRYKSIKKVEVNSESDAFTETKPKGSYSYNYGASFTQLQQINVPAVHDLGYKGQGVVVGVLDAGFNNLPHEVFANMDIIAMYDFVNNDPDVGDGNDMGDGSHGTQTLSTIGGFKEGKLIGPAFASTYILAKTENTESETPIEEDNWIAAIEWMDSIGVDVTSTSLGYIDFDSPYVSYSWQSMNGNTCRITIAADLAVGRGIVVVNSAGNEGYNSSHNTLGAPADGDSVIAVGAVTSTGDRSSFSSVGPTVDGRIKPDVMAMGSSVTVASTYNTTGYTTSSGTSFSGPLAGGVASLILCAMPNLTPMQVRDAMRNTASNSNSPNNEYGWGILNALEAINYFRVQIEHTPLSDTENPFRIHKVVANFVSRLPLIANQPKLYYSVNNGVSYDSVTFIATSTPNKYEAIIPVTQNNITVKYYIKAVNTSNVATVLPQGAPFNTFSFYIGQDTTPPVITHTSLGNQSLVALPINIEANVTDNLGVKSVKVYYKHNGVEKPEFQLQNIPNTARYLGSFPLQQNDLTIGDVIEYKIVAIDSSVQSNMQTAPSQGYYSFQIVNVMIYSSDFEANNGDLIGTNDWEWGSTVSPYPLAHSGSKLWGTKLNANYTTGPKLSTLTTPEMQVVSDNPTLTFWHSYDFESSYDGGNVKMSKNGGAYTLITPQNGYPGVISTSYNNPLAGQNAYVSSSNWTNALFNLAGLLQTGDIVKFKFDFGVDNSIQYKGWYIDDLSFTGIGIPLPVELISFSAKSINNSKIEISWATATEENNAGFEVERSINGKDFVKIGFVHGKGTTTEIQNYIYVDDLMNSEKQYYRLKQIDYSGLFTYSDVIFVANNLDYDFKLEQNYPNPFNPSTNISFSIKESGFVKLSVYNILGEKIVDLINENLNFGKYSIVFDASKYGLNSGIYLLKIDVDSKFSDVIKMALTK